MGKTTCAAATSLHYASLGLKTLVISTDPTPSLSHIFGVSAGDAKPAKVEGSLYANEFGVERARQMWERKFGKEVYRVFSSFVSIEYEEFLDFTSSLLPGLAEEFMIDYIRELYHRGEFETVVWDTAPLGQTLALLRTPAMLVEHLRTAPRVYSRLKSLTEDRESVMDVIRRWQTLSRESLDFVREYVEFTMVTIPEALAVQQLDWVFSELGRFRLRVPTLVINNVVKTQDSGFLRAKAKEQQGYIRLLHKKFGDMRVVELPMFPHELRGLDRLREVGVILCR